MFSCYPDMVYITSLEAWGLGDFTRHGNIDKSLSDKSLSLSLSPSFPFALDTNVYMHLHHCYYYGSWSVIRCTAYTPRPLYTITPSPQYNNKIIYIYILPASVFSSGLSEGLWLTHSLFVTTNFLARFWKAVGSKCPHGPWDHTNVLQIWINFLSWDFQPIVYLMRTTVSSAGNNYWIM